VEAEKLKNDPGQPEAGPAPAPARRPPRAQATGWRKWLYRLLAMTLVPLLVLGALELGLRLFGFGYPTDFFLKAKLDGRTVYVENHQFGRRFFPPGLERSPTQFVLPADKPARTYRIFVLGESAAQGFPDPSYGFARILEVLLRQQYPGIRFEVINTAMTAINSHVLLPIARECADHQPDLFIIYAGNNEVVGPYGAADVLGTYCPSRGVIRASIAAKSLKTGQLLGTLARAAGRSDGAPRHWGGLAMFLDNQVRATDPRLEGVYDHFRANLEDICGAGHAAGAQVIVCTVATNLKDCAPFGSLHDPGLAEEQVAAWDKAFAAGVRAESAGRHAEALGSYEQAAGIDPDYAELPFRQARCLAALGKDPAARDRYQAARDLDTVRLRADTRINDAIQAVAGGREAEGIHLVDVAEAFAQASPHGVPGEDFFYEHVHMNFAGNYLLARTVCRQLAAVLPDAVRSRAVAGDPLSEAECAERLGLTDFNRLQIAGGVLDLVNNPPFTNQVDHAERQAHWQRRVQELRQRVRSGGREPLLATYRKALELAADDTTLRGNYAALLQEYGDAGGAAEQWQLVLRRAPRDLRAHLNLGTLLAQQEKFSQALEHTSKALQIAPDSPFVHLTLGKIRARQGELDRALAAYAEALRLNPMMPDAHVARGEVLARQEKFDDAIAAYAEAVRLKPDYGPAHQGLALALFKAGRLDEAAQQYAEVVRLDPDNVAGHVNLANVLAQQKKFDPALAEYAAALRLQPDSEPIHYNLAVALEDAGRLDEAVTHLRQVLHTNPRSADVRCRLATVLARQGKADAAAAEFEEVLRQRPGWAEAAEGLARLRRQGKAPP
jgi:tetratricopeptide (TPR) repeat protein